MMPSLLRLVYFASAVLVAALLFVCLDPLVRLNEIDASQFWRSLPFVVPLLATSWIVLLATDGLSPDGKPVFKLMGIVTKFLTVAAALFAVWGLLASAGQTALGVSFVTGILACLSVGVHWLTAAGYLTYRQRLQLSVKGLLVLFAVLSFYMASWFPTKDYGPADIREQVANVNSVDPLMPLFLTTVETEGNGAAYFKLRHYYLWIFGFVVEMPYERRVN